MASVILYHYDLFALCLGKHGFFNLDLSKLMRLWYLSNRRPEEAFALRTHEVWKWEKGPKNQTSSLTGWLRMRV